MAKSKAKKVREQLVRKGKMDPNLMRGSWGELDGMTKKDKTKKETEFQILRKEDTKIKQKYKRYDRDNNGYAF